MNTITRRFLSLLLSLCLLLSAFPYVQAGESSDAAEEAAQQEQVITEAQSSLVYSENDFYFQLDSDTLYEAGGEKKLTLLRGGDVSKALNATLLVYDNSTNYGKDYVLSYQGQTLQKREGATSIYDAFRDGGKLTDGVEFDMSYTIGMQATEGETVEASAADAFRQLDELNAKAIELPITFPAGESTVEFTVTLLDDGEQEYEETLMLAVLDAAGNLSETAQMLLRISDNEAAPQVSVGFGCAYEIETDASTGLAELAFRRSGNLATFTTALLLKDGEILGYVDFSPYQELQYVWAVPGTYTLASDGAYTVTGETVTVKYVQGYEEVPEGADPILDAVPSTYASLGATQKTKAWSVPDWFPPWAQNPGVHESETYIAYNGTSNSADSNNSVFGYTFSGGTGSISKNKDGGRMHDLNTSGTFSRVSKNWSGIESYNKYYDMTGIQSVETTVKVEGLDYSNKIILELIDYSSGMRQTVASKSASNSNNNTTVTVSATLPDNYQGSVQVSIENEDPSGTDDGCHVLIPDGFKANKRTYRFVVTSPGYLYYRGIGDVKVNIQNSSSTMLREMGESVYVPIAYTVEGGHPVKLVGYKIRNMSTQATSGVLPLVEGQNSFIFNQAFLKAYEATYSAKTLDGENTYSTFEIIPVFEKIKTTVVLENSSMGTLSILNYSGEQLYVGEQIVLSGTSYADVNFVGVYYRKYRNLSGDIYESGEVHAQTTGGNVTLTLGEFNKIVLQPVFKSNSNQLTLAYEQSNPANRHGKHAFDNGKASMIVVKRTEYAKGEFFPLVATPDEGYVTRWTSNGRTYYGNTFYYQLDGYADNNTIMVAFIPEKDLQMETVTFSGTVNYYDCVLRDLTSTTKPLSEASYVITAGQEYSGKSGADGSFSIPDFKAVKGGTYSMMVVHGEYFRYLQFTPIPAEGSSQNMELIFPQFANNSFYPDQVRIALGTATSNDNVIQVRDTESGTITVRVVSQGMDCTVLGVTLYFVSTRAADYGAILATYTAYQDEMLTEENDSSIYTYWTLPLENPAELPAQSRMYIDVSAEKTVVTTDSEGNLTSQLQEFTSGKVNSGYEFIQAINDTSIAVQQSVPDLPGAQNGYSTNLEALEIPFIGSADFSFTSKSGGYFVNRSINGTTYLVCGYTLTAVYGAGALNTKIDGAIKTQQYLNAQKAEGRSPTGNTDVENVPLGQGGANQGGGDQQAAKKAPSPWAVSPAYLIKIALTPGVDENGEDKTFVTGFELAFGLDVFYRKSIPFNVHGVPFYIAFSVMVEALVQAQMQIQPGTASPGQDISLMLYQMCHDPEMMDSSVKSEQFFFSVPLLSMGLRAGVGYDCFLGIYIDGTISAPMMFQLDPNFDVAGSIGFTLAIGADLVLFNAKYNVLSPTIKYGKGTLHDDLKTVQAYMNITPPVFELNSVENSNPAVKTRVLSEGEETPDMTEILGEMTFSLMERPQQGTNLLRAGSIDSDVLAENVFKNTQIHLQKLDNGNILAMFLMDNGEEGLNYVSAAYAISEDNGETWGEVQLVSNNIGQAVSSVQYNINIYELQDRNLVTWSEADFDAALEGLDLNNLTAGQIATAMNAMNLRGRFFDATTGEPMGEAFTIAENSTVACAALNAVQNGDTVYVYYQRNIFDTNEDATIGDLLATERTIALAAANVNAPETWTSTPIRAENENGQQYRIADVTPFVHDGVMGEIIVLDRDGMLVTYNEETGEWDNSNEDRQLFLRTYDFDEEGKPVPTALLPITPADACAQSPQVVSTEDYLHLIWNQDGEILYQTDFVATYQDHPDVQEGAIVVLGEDGSVSVTEEALSSGSQITGSEALDIGTTFTASIADDGNVFLAWVAADNEGQDLNPVDEIYGVILNTVTNAEAIVRAGRDAEGAGNENTYQLWAVGSAIALTDEDSLIGAVDSICMESGKESKFLLAFTKLNATKRSEVTSADALVVQSVDAPDVVLNEIEAPTYPLPGSEMSVLVTFSNLGLEPLNGAQLTVSGLGEPVTMHYDAAVLPGETASAGIPVIVPEDYSADTTITVTVSGLGEQADYGDEGTTDIYYGAYFVLREMSRLVSVPNTTDCLTYTRVYNIGNCAGSPSLTFENTIFGTDEFYKEYSFQSEEVVAPGECLDLEYRLEDTLINTQRTAQLVAATGENVDQRMDSMMPVQDILIEEPATPADEIFTDLEGHWAVDYITEIYDEGLMIGTTETTFSPDQATARGMLATILYRLEGEPEFSGECPFADVPAGVYYEKPIAWAADQGILQGYGDGTFGPEDIVTREQMVTIFYRYAKSKGYDVSAAGDLSAFTDTSSISPYALDAVTWAVGSGLINGTEPTLLEPLGSTTRAQIAAIIVRFRNYFPEE